MSFRELAGQLGLEEDEFIELVTIFVETSQSDLDKLESAIDLRDTERLVEAAHSIKGASANLGFTELFSLAKDLEQNARKNSLEGATETLMHLKTGLGRIVKTLHMRVDSAI